MLNILILDNRDSFSHNLRHLFLLSGKCRVDVRATEDFLPELLEQYDALVLSPGPGLPDDHNNLKTGIGAAIGVMPIWGVCLGHQAIAEYYNGRLFQLPTVYHGIKSELSVIDRIGLWKQIEHADPVGRYHSWMVDKDSFPDCLVITSEDSEGRIMSFRHRDLPVFGVQFHPESFMTNQGLLLMENFLRFVEDWKRKAAALRVDTMIR